MSRQLAFTPAGLLFTSLAAVLACSAPPGAGGNDDDSVPVFGGTLPNTPGAPPAGPGVSPTPVGAAGTTSNTPGTSEAVGAGNVPIDNSGAGGAANVGAGNAASGSGGSAMTGAAGNGNTNTPPTTPGTPDPGAGGSAMTGAAGGGNAPVDNGQNGGDNGQNGGQNPPPVTPPPVTPPPVDPGPVGVGCAQGVAFFCEDFESFGVGTAQQNDRWRPEGNVSIDGQIVQGTRSLHVQANAGQASRIFVNGFAPPQNSFFGRMNVFVQAFPTAPNFAHYVLVEATGNGGERVRPIGGQLIQDQNTGNVWGVGSDGGATGDWTAWRATAPAVGGQWLCMEWQMDNSDSSIDVYIDGTLKPELSVSANAHDGNQVPFVFPTFNNIWLGWTVFQGGSQPAPFNVYLDDIVLSTQRVGCN